MTEVDDTQLDQLIRRRYAGALDGQLGRAESAFRRHLAEQSAAPAQAPHHPHGLRFGGRVFAFVGTALAASIAGLLVAPMIFRNPPQQQSNPNPSNTIPSQVAQNPPTGPTINAPMVHYLQNRTWDGGAVTVEKDRTGPAPARRIVQEQVERVRFYDPKQGAWIEILVPRRVEELREVDPY